MRDDQYRHFYGFTSHKDQEQLDLGDYGQAYKIHTLLKTTDIANHSTKIYLRDIMRFYGILISIILDRGIQFTLYFWSSFHKGLRTLVKLSMTDGQVERTIQILRDILRAYVVDFIGHCNEPLPLVEFTYNNRYQESIKIDLYDSLE